MKTDPRNRRMVQWCAALAALVGAAGGCQGPTSTVRFVSYKDAYFPEHVEADFSGCAYWIDAGRDIHIAGRAESKEKDDRAPITQYLHVQIYWHPYPGRTYADPTATDALIRYVVATGSGVAVYSGTGFAFPQQKLGGELEAVVESGRLQLESRTGDAPDLLGETRLTAVLHARKDAGATAKLIRTVELVAAR